MGAGNQRQGHVQVSPQLVGRARLTGIIAGDGQPATDFDSRVLKTSDVVTLPAMQRNRDAGKPFQRFLHIDAQLRVALPGQCEGLFNHFDLAWSHATDSHGGTT